MSLLYRQKDSGGPNVLLPCGGGNTPLNCLMLHVPLVDWKNNFLPRERHLNWQFVYFKANPKSLSRVHSCG